MSTMIIDIEDFYMRCSWKCKWDEINEEWVYDKEIIQQEKRKFFRVKNLPFFATISSVVLSVTIGTNRTGVHGTSGLKVDGSNATMGQTFTKDITSKITRNNEYYIEFRYAANGEIVENDTWQSDKLEFTDCTITITYTAPPTPVPAYDLEGQNVVVFDRMDTVFTGNGKCVLSPKSCTIKESAGGDYELTLTHPMDDMGKWENIQEECVIRAPIPRTVIPQITIPALSRLKVTADYTPLLKYQDYEMYVISNVIENPDQFEWSPGRYYSRFGPYSTDAMATDSGIVYWYRGNWNAGDSFSENNVVPPSRANYYASETWIPLIGISENDYTENPRNYRYRYMKDGRYIRMLYTDEVLSKLEDYGIFWRVRDFYGNVGFVLKSAVEDQSGTPEPVVIPSKTLETQLFRIYSISGNDEAKTVTVNAKHISYDYAKIPLMDCVFYGENPVDAVEIMQNAAAVSTENKIICNIASPEISRDWSNKNIVYTLLDPDDGLIAGIGAKLIRDNHDFYILSNANPQKSIDILYGYNLIGVSWKKNTADVYTSVIPVGKDGSDKSLYLDEVFVDSSNAAYYPVPKIMILNTGHKIGDTETYIDGTEKTLSKNDVLTLMLKEAQEKFSVDKVDVPTFTLDVNFMLIGDTEEYKQYRGLQIVNLYDEVTIQTGQSGITATEQVIGYEWDCLVKRYNRISIGKLNSIRFRIPGYQMKNGSITYEKLSQGLLNKLAQRSEE